MGGFLPGRATLLSYKVMVSSRPNSVTGDIHSVTRSPVVLCIFKISLEAVRSKNLTKYYLKELGIFFFKINLYTCLKFLIPSDFFLMNYKYMLHFIIQLIFKFYPPVHFTLYQFNKYKTIYLMTFN